MPSRLRNYDLLDRCSVLEVEESDFYGTGCGIDSSLGIIFFPCSWRAV